MASLSVTPAPTRKGHNLRLDQTLKQRRIKKRELARMLQKQYGGELQAWERSVYAWTSQDNPRAMSDEKAEQVAGVLGDPPDTFKIGTHLQALEQAAEEDEVRWQELDERLLRIERLLGLLGAV